MNDRQIVLLIAITLAAMLFSVLLMYMEKHDGR
jgi:hypothetical protein